MSLASPLYKNRTGLGRINKPNRIHVSTKRKIQIFSHKVPDMKKSLVFPLPFHRAEIAIIYNPDSQQKWWYLRGKVMFKNLFESTAIFLKSIICGSLLVAATATAITFAYFIVMTCYRLIGSVWAHLFSQPWP